MSHHVHGTSKATQIHQKIPETMCVRATQASLQMKVEVGAGKDATQKQCSTRKQRGYHVASNAMSPNATSLDYFFISACF